MPRKTNKTSHVLNLLTNGSGEAPASPAQTAPVQTAPQAASSSQAAPARPSLSPSSPAARKVTVVDEAGANSRTAQDILAGLTEELEKDEAGEREKTAQTADARKKADQGTDAWEEDAQTADAPRENPQNAQKNFLFVNVMEELVKSQDLDKYIKDYQVCGCSRCRADVCALALTWLPPKYIVTERETLPILLSYYGNRYRIPILTQLVKACIQVREDPRHDRHTPPTEG